MNKELKNWSRRSPDEVRQFLAQRPQVDMSAPGRHIMFLVIFKMLTSCLQSVPGQAEGTVPSRCCRPLARAVSRTCPVERRPRPGCVHSTRIYSRASCRGSASSSASHSCLTHHHRPREHNYKNKTLHCWSG